MSREGYRFGLALGGGGLLGAAHVGVLEVLEEHGLVPEVITGTSAGALVAALWAAGLPVSRIRRLALGLKRKDLYAWNFTPYTFMLMLLRNLRELMESFHAMPRGLLDGSGLQRYVEQATGMRKLTSLPVPAGLVAADLLTGRRVIFSNREITAPTPEVRQVREAPLGLAVQASTAIPGVFEPVAWGGMLLADGGLVELVPAATARLLGADLVVAVCFQGKERVPEPDSIVQVIMRGINLLNRRGAEQDLEVADLVVAVPAIEAGLGDFHRIPQLLELGRTAAAGVLPELKRMLRG